MGPDRLTIEEAAAYAGVAPHSVRNSIFTKALPILPERTQAGRQRVLIAKEDLLAWMAQRQEKQALTQVRKEVLQQRAQRRSSLDPARPRPGSQTRCHQKLPEFGELLKKTRLQTRLTLTEVAQRADICPSYVSRMESAGEVPRREKILAIAAVLEVDPNPLLLVCGYAPEKHTQLGGLLEELTQLPPQDQDLALELARTYARGTAPERSSLLSFIHWWRQAPESERQRAWGVSAGASR